MNGPLKWILVGVGITLVLGGAALGLWSMSIAPPPPAMAKAAQDSKLVRAEVFDHMDEFLRHDAHAEAAMAMDHTDLARAHLMIMQEVAEELRADHLATRVPPEKLGVLQANLANAVALLDKSDPGAKSAITALKLSCTACHATQNGPHFGVVRMPAAAATSATSGPTAADSSQ